MKKNIIIGAIFIVLGIISGLNALGITNINIFFSGWWTFLIIVPCFVGLFKKEKSKSENVIGLLVGIFLLLKCQEENLTFLDMTSLWKLFLPVVSIIVGIAFILKNTNSEFINDRKTIKKKGDETYVTFSVHQLNYANENFDGGTFNAIFGGIEINLKDAKLPDECVINASCIFGGIDIFVDSNVCIKVNSNSFFGGVSKKCKTVDGTKTIYVNADCIFGGVEIKEKDK